MKSRSSLRMSPRSAASSPSKTSSAFAYPGASLRWPDFASKSTTFVRMKSAFACRLRSLVLRIPPEPSDRLAHPLRVFLRANLLRDAEAVEDVSDLAESDHLPAGVECALDDG